MHHLSVLPDTGLARLLGLSPLPDAFSLLLFAMVTLYLLLVELATSRFHRHRAVRPDAPIRTQTENWTDTSDLEHRDSSTFQGLNDARPNGLKGRCDVCPYRYFFRSPHNGSMTTERHLDQRQRALP